MKMIDITRTIQQAPVYPNEKHTQISKVMDMDKGDSYNFSLIETTSHAGTHADALSHFIKSNVTIDKMPLEKYYGDCDVISVPSNSIISVEDIKGKVTCKKVVIHGGGMSYLSSEAAKYIVDCGVETVVTDALSVARLKLEDETEIHQILLGAKIAVVENVILDNVKNGRYTLCAFPIKYGECDGAPVRAILIEQ